jgi:peptide/nickel transport system substrate-binding protein
MQSAPYAQSGNPDPDPSEAFHSRGAIKGTRNYSSYKNDKVDQLLDQAISTLDQSKRKELYVQLQSVLNEDIPSFNTPFWAYGWAANKRVKGMGPDRIGTFAQYSRWFMSQVWVNDGK